MMEIRRVADALLRSQTSPLATFLAPSTATRWASQGQRRCRQAGHRSIGRQFSTTLCRNAIRPTTTTTSAPAPAPAPTPSSESTQQIPSDTPSNDQESSEELAKRLGWAAPASSQPRTIREILDKRTEGGMNSSFEKRMNGGNSANDILAMLAQKTSESSSIDTTKMLSPNANDTMQAIMDSSRTYAAPRATMTLNASTGRSISVNREKIDVGRAFRLLEQSCARNGIRHLFNSQRFHERGGMKRKRLRRERWRRKFMDGFRATVTRVKVLKRQGW